MPVNPMSLLDNIRLSNGSEGLKNYYCDLLQVNREKALEMINDQQLQFGTLFLLRHEFSKAAALTELKPLYQKALEIAAKLVGIKTGQTEKAMRSGKEDTASVLRWMIKTGYIEGDSDKDYEQLMEHAAALLAISFKDTAALPEIADMIFARYRNGRLVHELVWAFFEARCPDSLLYIAQRLNSPDSRDIELSKRLLCFIPEIDKHSGNSGSGLYARVLFWLQENKPFLYYTGESLHLCSNPLHYAVSWVSKYLCLPVSADNGEPLLSINELENELSTRFRELPELLQHQLADFSYMLYRKNIYQWNTWIRLDLGRQVSLATYETGGLA